MPKLPKPESSRDRDLQALLATIARWEAQLPKAYDPESFVRNSYAATVFPLLQSKPHIWTKVLSDADLQGLFRQERAANRQSQEKFNPTHPNDITSWEVFTLLVRFNQIALAKKLLEICKVVIPQGSDWDDAWSTLQSSLSPEQRSRRMSAHYTQRAELYTNLLKDAESAIDSLRIAENSDTRKKLATVKINVENFSRDVNHTAQLSTLVATLQEREAYIAASFHEFFTALRAHINKPPELPKP